MCSMVVISPERHYTSASLQFGLPLTYLMLQVGTVLVGGLVGPPVLHLPLTPHPAIAAHLETARDEAEVPGCSEARQFRPGGGVRVRGEGDRAQRVGRHHGDLHCITWTINIVDYHDQAGSELCGRWCCELVGHAVPGLAVGGRGRGGLQAEQLHPHPAAHRCHHPQYRPDGLHQQDATIPLSIE